MNTKDGRQILTKDSGLTDFAIVRVDGKDRAVNTWHGEILPAASRKLLAAGPIRDAWWRPMVIDDATGVIAYVDAL